MGPFAVGDIVLVRFPYSDLSRSKKRPGLVIGFSDFDNLIVCQITSKAPNPKTSIAISDADLVVGGGLLSVSYIRANKFFTADRKLITKNLGSLRPELHGKVYKLILEAISTLGE